MLKLQIVNINDYEYELKDGENNSYKVNLEFYDLDKKLSVNDYIFISEKLLNKNYKEYDTFYRFGKLNSKYGRDLNYENDTDIIGLKMGKDLMYMQRYYG